MKIKLIRSYVNSKENENGEKTTPSKKYLYSVNGSEEDLAKYKELMGDYFRTEETTGEPLYFTKVYHGENAILEFTKAGKVYVNNDELDKVANLVERFPGTMGRYIAEYGLKKFFDKNPELEPEQEKLEISSQDSSDKL